jgi:hypothetical protein
VQQAPFLLLTTAFLIVIRNARATGPVPASDDRIPDRDQRRDHHLL